MSKLSEIIRLSTTKGDPYCIKKGRFDRMQGHFLQMIR